MDDESGRDFGLRAGSGTRTALGGRWVPAFCTWEGREFEKPESRL